MPSFQKGDSVEAKKDLAVGGGTIEKGRRGTVTATSASTSASVRVKFVRDTMRFRVVPKSAVKRV